MPITTREARQLSTVNEWTLVEASLPDRIRELSPARLKAKIGRARTLRDKYRDIAKRQHRQAQPRRTGRPNEAFSTRTARKVELFERVLARFEQQLERVAAKNAPAPATRTRPGSPEARPAGRKKSKRAASGSPAPPKVKAKRIKNPAVPKSAVGKRSGQQRIHAHVSSAGRRTQGRRDTRRR